MNKRPKFEVILNHYRMLGLWEAIKGIMVYFLDQGKKDLFDQKYGVSTGAQINAVEASISSESSRADVRSYFPIPEVVMRHILKNVTKGLALNEFSFIDFGSGKGRVLIIAVQYPFRKVIGVEVSPVLCDIAASNVQCYLSSHHDVQCRDIGVHCESALDFDLPDTNLLIYMYRPFYAELLKKVLDKLSQFQAATGRQVLVVFCCPQYGEKFLDEHPSFVKQKDYQVIHLNNSWGWWECRFDTSLQPGSDNSAMAMRGN